MTEEDLFCIADSPLDDSFCNIFIACLTKRLLLYSQSPRHALFDIVLPACLLIIGVSGTKLDAFARSESRILTPERISMDPELLIIDR
jgi:hypothetical protein